jgi:hypothetical protein
MRIGALIAFASVGAMTFGLMGCSSSTPPPPFEGGGQTSNAPTYPPGPYGTSVGSQVQNFDFVGYANEQADHTAMALIQLSDFYNPHAFDTEYNPASPEEDDRVFQPGTQYNPGTTPIQKPTVLNIDIASVWCGPCNEEAGSVLPVLHKMYAPCGGEFLLVLADGPTVGTAALPKNLYAWADKYKENFPTAIDPEYKTEVIWAAEAFPENIQVDTTTMTIIDRIAGVPPTQICSDETALCNTESAFGPTQLCASGASCQKFEYWANYEAHLDKSRAGCQVQ